MQCRLQVILHVVALVVPLAHALKMKDLGVSSMPSSMLSEQERLQMRVADQWVSDTSPTASLLASELPSDISKYLPSTTRKDHVAARRILAHEIHTANPDGSQNSKLGKLVHEYAGIYANEFHDRLSVFFSHVSKSAGTTLCICGQRNGCVGSGMTKNKDPVMTNCHAGADDPNSPDDGPHWAAKKQHPAGFDTCAALAKYASTHKYTLEGNENWLIGEGICPQFWNVIVVRDPIDRLISHMQELSKLPEHATSAEVVSGPTVWDPASPKLTPEFIFKNAPIISNNYYIRSLLGAETYKLPFGAINATHLEKAKRILDKFDLVLIQHPDLLEDLSDYIGWHCGASRRIAPDDFGDGLRAAWDDAQWKKIEKHNALDMKLAAYAATLYRIDKLVMKHDSFKVPSKCGKAECGFLCKTGPLADYINKTLAGR
mmetsp:Transcript_59373/g.141546  ORF Transcript_59373/g.141546 Transcript_59373/m.141546 type:complete len:430 (-) Transcript_59373:50-1339(-)